jgi:hypothetical protein
MREERDSLTFKSSTLAPINLATSALMLSTGYGWLRLFRSFSGRKFYVFRRLEVRRQSAAWVIPAAAP